MWFRLSLSQATSKNIGENLRIYKGYQLINEFILFPKKPLQVSTPLLGRGRGRFSLGVFLLMVQASLSQATSKNMGENLRIYKGYQLINEFILFPKKPLQARTPLLGNRRSLFVERAKRGKQWAGGGSPTP